MIGNGSHAARLYWLEYERPRPMRTPLTGLMGFASAVCKCASAQNRPFAGPPFQFCADATAAPLTNASLLNRESLRRGRTSGRAFGRLRSSPSSKLLRTRRRRRRPPLPSSPTAHPSAIRPVNRPRIGSAYPHSSRRIRPAQTPSPIQKNFSFEMKNTLHPNWQRAKSISHSRHPH